MYMREVCEYTLTNNSDKIGGVNPIVKIDEIPSVNINITEEDCYQINEF